MPQDVIVAWSGGKDSALALREIRSDARYRVAALLTTVTAQYDRISMHGVRFAARCCAGRPSPSGCRSRKC